MAFVKVQKTKAYFKRYQVKFRRRREGKTDYRARKRLICQDKNKYNSPKYRLVVRFSNRYCLAQIIYATIQGDVGMDEKDEDQKLENMYKGQGVGVDDDEGDDDDDDDDEDGEADGQVVKCEMKGRTYYVDEVDEDRRPFRALLDVGIRSTSTGNRVFGCMKGATDGGLDVPHNEKRFPGYDRDTKSYDAEVHRDHIYGAHVAEYMEYLMEEDEAKYKEHFAEYIAEDIDNDGVEEMYKECHKAIREDPSPPPKKAYTPDKSFKNAVRLSYDARKARVEEKKAALKAAKEAEDDDDDE